jgi:cysteinyl-tRNA synthetase
MITGLSIYDTKSRSIQPIKITNAESVRIYCCGPTVYRDAHVGNFRTFMLTDLVVRTLHFRGVQTFTIQNITDVGHMSEGVTGTETIESNEDKVLTQAIQEERDPFSIAKEYEQKFHLDLARLNITPADGYPKASDSIALMQDLIEVLIAKGNAYVANEHSVYFAAKTFESYGAISGNDLMALKPGYRFEYSDDRSKRFHADWALWKSAEHRTEMIWPSKWGMGFPGWHIECSAMSLHFLNQHIDLHVGGIDLRFPHHENERAQSNSAIENAEAVALWLHGEHLLFEGKKMSKSSGNVLLVSEVIEKGFDPLALRLCFLENRYRSQMDLTWAQQDGWLAH